MLTKNDLKLIKSLLKDVAKQKDLDLVKKDLSSVKADVSSLKADVSVLKKDMKSVTVNLKDLTDFVKTSIPPIFKWTDEIHNTVVRENLPQRVKKLEQIVKNN